MFNSSGYSKKTLKRLYKEICRDKELNHFEKKLYFNNRDVNLVNGIRLRYERVYIYIRAEGNWKTFDVWAEMPYRSPYHGNGFTEGSWPIVIGIGEDYGFTNSVALNDRERAVCYKGMDRYRNMKFTYDEYKDDCI